MCPQGRERQGWRREGRPHPQLGKRGDIHVHRRMWGTVPIASGPEPGTAYKYKEEATRGILQKGPEFHCY